MSKTQALKKQLKKDPKGKNIYTNQNINDPLNNFQDVTFTPATVDYHARLTKAFQYLKTILIKWSIFSNQVPSLSERQIILKYLDFYYQYTQADQFDSSFEVMSNLQVNYQRISNDQIIYKSYNIFKKSSWNVRFNPKFISKLKQYSINQIKYVLSMVMMLADGKFFSKTQLKNAYGYVRPINFRCFSYNRFFTLKIHKQKNAVVNVGVQKYPVLSRNNIIKRYEYRCYIQFWDIVNDSIIENPKKVQQTIKRFLQVLDEDVAKKDIGQQLQIDTTKWSKNNKYFFVEHLNPYTDVKQIFETAFQEKSVQPYSQFVFKPTYLSSSETSSLVFDKQMKRWVAKDYRTNLQQKAFKQYQKKINQQMIKRFVDFQSARSLVQLLTKIPNFKVNLTQQEKNVIGQNGNVMVIGRSGTGKTTCAILRLFSIEMLFKIRLSLYKKKFESTLKDTRCSADDIDQTVGLHCIFLTASPVLTNQIQRYYKKITDNIKQELNKKKKAVQAQRKLQEQKQKLDMAQISQRKEESNQNSQLSVDASQSFQDLNQKSQINTKYQNEQIKKRQQQGNMQLDGDEEIVPTLLKVTKSKQCIQQQQEMNNQLKDIKLKEDVGNLGFNQQQEQQNFDDMKQKMEEKMEKFQSLDDLQESDYPGFFTVKSYIMMIDGTLKKPFFIRNKNKQLIEQDSKAAWHNQQKGVMMIENYYKGDYNDDQSDDQKVIDQVEEEINYSDEEQLEHQYMRQIQLRQNKNKQTLTKKLQEKKVSKLSFQVDFDYFSTYFWPNVQKMYYSQKNITAHLVWTQIFSCIKGSAGAHLYPGQYIPEKVYLQQSSNVFLSKQEKKDIYETFCQYQRWKLKAGGYDIMDTVNYILNFIRFRGYTGPQIHYVMIDQVQDLPHAIIYLLSKTATYGVFYSGDTAQTIAKGVGFRFCDLKNLFNSKLFDVSLSLKAPIVKQLTVNFRSHNNILQLANSVVSTLQILFPKTIDKLKKERSNLDGPKPIILSENDEELLFYVLCGDQTYKNSRENQINAMKKPPLQFGCDQVIIVRNQQSKNKIPSMLQHALCLTVYQAKGLQFNDVILFNFFSQSKCPDKWNLLKYLNTIEVEYTKQEYQALITKHITNESKDQKVQQDSQKKATEQQQEQMTQNDVQCIVDDSKQIYKIKKLVSDTKMALKDINDFAQLCSDLKMLYTAITRPRQTLIIYDEQAGCRKSIERIWEKLEVIQIINRKMLEQNTNSNNSIKETQQIKIFKNIITSTSQEQWKKQGIKMYSRGYYQQAKKCFDRSGNTQLYKKAHANQLADNSTRKLIQIQAQRNAIANGMFIYRNMTSSQLSKLKKKNKVDQHQSHLDFVQAAFIFEELKMFKHAGQCFFSGKNFVKAEQSFRKAMMNKQVAECLQMQNKFREAAQFYEKDDNYLKVIECLDMMNDWDVILQKINKYTYKMSEYEKQSLLKKYAALSLQGLVYEIQFQNDPQKQKKNQQERVEVIKQQDSQEQQDWDQQIQQNQQKINEVQSQTKQQDQKNQQKPDNKTNLQEKKLIQSVYQQASKQIAQQNKQDKQENKSQSSQSFADLNQQNTQQKKKLSQTENQKPKEKQKSSIKSVNQSFSDLNQPKSQSSFSDLNVQFPQQLEPDIQSIKSMADPEDQWIKSALSQIPKNTQSQYSIIDEQQNYNPNIRIIKTRGNIFIQDKVMQKIIKIVSIVNDTAKEFLKQFKGYQSLISISKQANEENIIDNRPQISEFQDIDPAFINIVLDTLESFKLYKLCLFVCNRYHLPHKAGRYLISIAMKYSTNCISNIGLNPSLLAPSIMRKTELEKGILASIALHAIFQNVNSQFLKVKVSQSSEKQDKNSLGSYFIEGLVLQGLLKKAVFMVNYQQSLQLLYNYFEYTTYRQIYRQKVLKISPQQKQLENDIYNFSENVPKKKEQKNMAIFNLETIIHQYSIINQLQFISHRLLKQSDTNAMQKRLKKIEIPSYLPYFKALFEGGHQQFAKKFSENYLTVAKILTQGENYQIYDLVSSIVFLLSNFEIHRKLIYSLKNLQSFLEFYHCIKLIKLAVDKFNGPKNIEIIQSLLSVYKCRFIRPCKSMSFINDTYVLLDRSSILVNQFVEKSKKNPNMIAFFFQQDFNLILVKFYDVIKNLKNKFNYLISKFLKEKVSIILNKDGKSHKLALARNLQILTDIAVQYNLQMIQRQNPIYKKSKVLSSNNQKKNKLPAFDYKTHGHQQLAMQLDPQLSSDSEYDGENFEQSFVQKSSIAKVRNIPYFGDALKVVSQQILHVFNHTSKNSKMAFGKLLFNSGLNNYYREYVQKRGGYNLYDAMQFKKFKRVDLYADNILSIIDDLPIKQKHTIIGQILVLLTIQLKYLIQGKQFKVQFTRSKIKYFEDLSVQTVIHNDKNIQKKMENLNLLEQTQQIFQNEENQQSQTILSYLYTYSSQLNIKDTQALICQYLNLASCQNNSKDMQVPLIVINFLKNIRPSKQIYETLRNIINDNYLEWDIGHYFQVLVGHKSYQSFIQKRQQFLNSKKIGFRYYQIRVTCKPNLDKAIEQSEKNYQIQTSKIQQRKAAAIKIGKWWKHIKQRKIQYIMKHGCFKTIQKDRLCQNRLIKNLYHTKVQYQFDRKQFMSLSSGIRDNLMHFYLKNYIGSSLDLHFILMTLNKIQQARTKYIQIYKTHQKGLIQVDLLQLYEQMLQLQKTIEVWKNDDKWLKNKNINLKKKKLFEVKWMRKSIQQNKIMKKRAGLKKLHKLEQKKFLKKFH